MYFTCTCDTVRKELKYQIRKLPVKSLKREAVPSSVLKDRTERTLTKEIKNGPTEGESHSHKCITSFR